MLEEDFQVPALMIFFFVNPLDGGMLDCAMSERVKSESRHLYIEGINMSRPHY